MVTMTARRYVLVPETRPSDRGARVRRYRLARLRMDALERGATGRFAYLKRTYD
jgi:hypothetical protein